MTAVHGEIPRLDVAQQHLGAPRSHISSAALVPSPASVGISTPETFTYGQTVQENNHFSQMILPNRGRRAEQRNFETSEVPASRVDTTRWDEVSKLKAENSALEGSQLFQTFFFCQLCFHAQANFRPNSRIYPRFINKIGSIEHLIFLACHYS
jgi:hypothetical protein